MICKGNAYVLTPTAVTDAMLTSSTAPEPAASGETAWNAATAYVAGDRAYLASNHTIYQRLIAGTTAGSPDVDTDNWAPAGPTNRWSMFDTTVGTTTAIASPLTVVLRPGQIGGLFADELVGLALAVTVKDPISGASIYTKSVSLDDTVIGSVSDWFFTPFAQKSTVTLVDLPDQYFDPEITVTVSGSGAVACGTLKVGPVVNIGGTLMDASIAIIDYSKKETDDFGITRVVERAFSKQLTCKVLTDRSNFNRNFKLFAGLRATVAVYIASTQAGLEPLTVQGFPTDWSIDVPYLAAVQCNLQIEGINQ